MKTEQKYTAANISAIIPNAFEQTATDECNEALCKLFAEVSPSFTNSVLFKLQQGFLKTDFFKEVDYLEETTTLFYALEGFFRVCNQPENQVYIKKLTKETFDGRLVPAL